MSGELEWMKVKSLARQGYGGQGVYELEFMRDESSEYTKCHVNNEALARDVIGEKIKSDFLNWGRDN